MPMHLLLKETDSVKTCAERKFVGFFMTDILIHEIVERVKEKLKSRTDYDLLRSTNATLPLDVRASVVRKRRFLLLYRIFTTFLKQLNFAESTPDRGQWEVLLAYESLLGELELRKVESTSEVVLFLETPSLQIQLCI